MARIALDGAPIYTEGNLPACGRPSPGFSLTASNLVDLELSQLGRRCKLINIVPSLELPACDRSTERFEALMADECGAALVTITADLPFSRAVRRGSAHAGACDPRGAALVLSAFRCAGFARAWGVEIVSGPLRGLLAAAVIVLDGDDRVAHAELVREISRPPDHAAALAALRKARHCATATAVAATAVASVAR